MSILQICWFIFLYILYKCLSKYKYSYYIYIYVAHCDFHIVCLEHIVCTTKKNNKEYLNGQIHIHTDTDIKILNINISILKYVDFYFYILRKYPLRYKCSYFLYIYMFITVTHIVCLEYIQYILQKKKGYLNGQTHTDTDIKF